MKQEALTQERLKELLSYDTDTGVFTWKNASGKIAGHLHKGHGYLAIGVDKKVYLAHRLAWLYVYGVWPKEQLDHINGKKDDNCLANLREATMLENHQNRSKNKNNKSGYVGVSYDKKARKWRAQIAISWKVINLGYWDTPEMSDKAYRLYKAQIHTFNPIVREA